MSGLHVIPTISHVSPGAEVRWEVEVKEEAEMVPVVAVQTEP